MKERVYVKNPSEAPKGVKVQEGERGGLYYESSGISTQENLPLIPKVLSYDEKYKMSSREIHSKSNELINEVIKDLPNKKSILNLHDSLTASSLGGGALQSIMKDIKSFLKVYYNIADIFEKKYLEENVDEDTIKELTEAMPFFENHGKYIQKILKERLGNSITVYRGIYLDKEDVRNSIENNGYINISPLEFESVSSRPGAARMFGNTLIKFDIPISSVIADSSISPLFVDNVEDEILVNYNNIIKAKILPSNLDILLEDLPKNIFNETSDTVKYIPLLENTQKSYIIKDGYIIQKPFAGYKDFSQCISENKDKDDPNAYCGAIKHKVEKQEVQKGKVYVDNPQEAPEGVKVSEGERGGLYYESQGIKPKVIEQKPKDEEFFSQEREQEDDDDKTYIPKIANIKGLRMEILEDKKDRQLVSYQIPDIPKEYQPQIFYDSAQEEAMTLGGYDFDGKQINIILEAFEKYSEEERQFEILETLKHEYIHYFEDKLGWYNKDKELPQYFKELKKAKLKEEGNFFSMEQAGSRKADMEIIAYALQHKSFKEILNIFLNFR